MANNPPAGGPTGGPNAAPQAPGSQPPSGAGSQTSSAKLIQKTVADKMQEFLTTKEWSDALGGGKEHFLEKFFAYMDSNHEDLLISFKKLHGKDEKDELTLDDIGDITLTYEDTYESYIENAVREHFEEQQEKAVAQAFLKKMDKLLGGAEFSDALRQLWGKYVLPRKDSIQDVADMQRILKQFFQRAGSSITDAQKKKLTKVSVAYRDVADQLADEGVLDPVIADRIQQKRIISLNTDAEESVKQFLRTYVKTDLVPAYAAMQAGVQDIASLYKVPGFSLALSSYDLSVQNLLKDKEFQKVFSDASATEEQKNQAQQRAAAKLISQTDKDLGKITEQLFANEYNLARLGKAEQQAYITRFASKRESSEQMKAIDTFLTSINLSAAQRKSIFDQLFNLSSDKLQFEGSNGEKYTLPLQKKIIDRNWSAETLSAQMNAPLPLIFLISPSEHLDEAYLQRLTKSEDKSFSLTGADGKPMTIFPSHLIEIADRNGNKKKGYLYKDPQGKYFLLPQPGSTQREELDEKEVHASTVQLVEPTYSFEAEQVPEFMTHLLMTAEAANRTDEEMHDALQERNSDIADQTLSEEFAREDNTPPVTDSEIETINWDNNEEVAALSDERKEKLQKKIDEDLTRIAGRLQKLDKRINDQDALIKTLTQKVHVESAQKPFNQEQFDRLNNSLTKAQEERDNLLDEKNSLLAKKEKLTDAQKTLKDTQKKDDAKESEKKALSKSVETEKGFGNTWKDLSGDNTITSPLPGKSCIMVSLPDASSSLTGGGAARVRGDIVSYDPDTETMVVERHGVEGPLKWKEGARSTIEGAEGLKDLKRKVGKMYKFKKYSSVGDRGMDLKGGVSTSDDGPQSGEEHFHFDKKYEGRWKHLKDDIDFPSMKNQRTKKDIKYFGKKSGDQRAWYEVEVNGWKVKVRQMTMEKDAKDLSKVYPTYERTMPVNDFMMFAMEKDLRGYTQEEVDSANGADNDSARAGANYIADWIDPSAQDSSRFGRGAFNMKRGSIAGILAFRETTKKGIKSHFEEKQKKTAGKTEDALLGAGWFKAMEKIPLLGSAIEDVRIGLDSKRDNEKKKKINEYKDEVDTKKDSSSNGASDFIQASLTDAEAHAYPEKAAGYFLYALEKGGNPYFRTLKKEEGKGYRVGKILGKNYVPKYLAYMKNVEQELVKNPSSRELLNDKAKGELGFMQKLFNEGGDALQPELKRLLGNWFFTGGLGAAEYTMRYNSSKIDETYKNEGAKPFHQLYKDSRTGRYEGFRVNDVLAVLKLLGEKVGGNEDYYYQWSGSMLMPLLNGQYRSYMVGSYQNIYQQIARKNAFPFAAYITEGNATEKIQQLLDIFSNGSLSEAMGSASSVAERTAIFKKRREANGRSALDALQNPKQLFAKKKELEANRGNQEVLNQYNTLTDYINHKYNDEDRTNVTEEVDGESIIYQKNILSAPSGFVAAQMLNYSNGQFKGKSEKHWPDLWLALKSKLQDIQNVSSEEMTPDFFAFLLKRYFTIFQNRYSGTAKRKFVAALKYPNIPDIFKLNIRGMFDKKFGGDDLPGEMEDTLIIFEKLFAQHAQILAKNPDLLEDVFDDPRMVDYYRNATQEDIISDTDSMKKRQAEIKRRIESGLVDDYELDNFYW